MFVIAFNGTGMEGGMGEGDEDCNMTPDTSHI